MILYNYTSLKKRDKKVYSVAGANISQTGISTSFLKVVAPCTLATTLVGVIICVLLNKNFFYPLGEDFSFPFVLFFIGSGLSAGLAGWYIKVESYRLYEYVRAYIKPKKTYHTENSRNREFSLYSIKTKGIVKSEL